tara:strand:+ start:4181 stop:5044 length:864 start_codon:yes stop_codon:yes gene_type:complete
MLAPVNDTFFGIQIFHLPTSDIAKNQINGVRFKGWVTEFQDQFTSTWNEEPVYGRMDPLSTFQRTARIITLAFDVVAEDADSAQQNLISVNKLITFLYPVYRGTPRTNGNTLAAAPLLGMRWTNLIADAGTGDYLVGYLNGATYAPVITDGGFINQRAVSLPNDITEGSESADNPDATRLGLTKNFIPKTLNLNLTFTVLHTHLAGWIETKEGFVFGNKEVNGKFPNAFGIVDVEQPTQVLTQDENGNPQFRVEAIGNAEAAALLGAGTIPGVVTPVGNPWVNGEDK